MLELVDVKKTYRIGPINVEALKGVSFKVDRGELVSIMGTSGCGKSTLMNIMGLLDRPTSGRYALQGSEVAELSDDERSDIRNRRIGFVFQSFHLLSRLSALENVELPLLYRGMKGREIQERSYEFLKKVSMEDRAHHRPNELSGGQQQRVAIARALAGAPAIILADEPTGALDTRVGRDILDLFIKVNIDEAMTIILITHDPGIAKECRRCVHMEDGIIIEA